MRVEDRGKKMPAGLIIIITHTSVSAWVAVQLVGSWTRTKI